MVSTTAGFASEEISTKETLLATAFSTHACRAAPSASETSAMPRGAASTATRPSTSPESASTVNTLSDPAAVTTNAASSSVTWMPNGVASAMPAAGCSGGRGSKSKNVGWPQLPRQFTRVIWLRKARFSISAKPCLRVPARPFSTLRASVCATKTRPLPSTAMP